MLQKTLFPIDGEAGRFGYEISCSRTGVVVRQPFTRAGSSASDLMDEAAAQAEMDVVAGEIQALGDAAEAAAVGGGASAPL